MAITQDQLGQRLRQAREAAGLTQGRVAEKLGISRPTLAQMELGGREVTSIELDRLAYLYGRDIRSFLQDDFQPDDALTALFRADPALSDEDEVADHLRWCMAVARELGNLESLLEITDGASMPARYDLAPLSSRWQAVDQGVRVAYDERNRLDLGDAAIADMAELLESQGVRAMATPLLADVSGLTAHEQATGAIVAVNKDHPVLRRRFSYAHEYAHVLLDRTRTGTVSRFSNDKALLEMRANAFAAAFLMPEHGLRRLIEAMGKGRPSRAQQDIGDEQSTVHTESRARPGSQEIQIYDVVHAAHAFGVSAMAALYRLGNLRPPIMTTQHRDRLRDLIDRGVDVEARDALGLPAPDQLYPAHDQLRHRLVSLGLEAYRQELISRGKLADLGSLVGVERQTLDRLIQDSGIEHD